MPRRITLQPLLWLLASVLSLNTGPIQKKKVKFCFKGFRVEMKVEIIQPYLTNLPGFSGCYIALLMRPLELQILLFISCCRFCNEGLWQSAEMHKLGFTFPVKLLGFG